MARLAGVCTGVVPLGRHIIFN